MSKIDLRIRNNNKLYSIVLNDYRIGGCKWNDIEHGKCIEFPVNKEDVFVALGVDKTIANLQLQLDQQKAMWNELKEWILDIWKQDLSKELSNGSKYSTKHLIHPEKLLYKMQELEGEDE